MRILIAEDDRVTRRFLEANLKNWGHDIVACEDGTQAWEELNKPDAPKLVVLDWVMTGMDGPTLCKKIRKMETKPYTYIILLTAKSSKQDIIDGLEAGSDDYITKPFDPQELRVRIRAATRIIQLQQDLVEALKASEFQATHDALTGLWNRHAIIAILGREVARSTRESKPLTVIMADIDHFKKINDMYGHLVGDAALRETASRLRSSIRQYDSVGRYGCEEFLIIFPNCDQACAQSSGKRLRSVFEQNKVISTEATFSMTLSLGAVVVAPGSNHLLDDIIGTADEALYKAKGNGRNRIEFAELR
ncbi:MAG: diguanylate cyclase [Syntrophaceae bacterium]|nr:diguanylate cyclase [Syntrophaceae bacterium]